MGFIKTLSDSISSEIKDQYIEVFKTDSLGQDVLVKRATRLNSKRHNKGDDEIISAGSKIMVPEGTYALMIDNGQIVDSVTEPGMYTWNTSSSGSLLSGGLKSVMADAFDRFRFAGEITKVQRIYFVNGLEIMNQTCNDFITSPYPDPFYGNLYFKFKIVFSFRIVDPVTFYKKTGKETRVCDFMGTPWNPRMPIYEVTDHMEEALNLCAVRDKVPFPHLISNKSRLKDAVNEVVSRFWLEQRGMVIESIALNDLILDEASRKRVEQYDSASLFANDPEALRALAILGFTDALNAAASNSAGAMTGLAGLRMAAAMAGVTQPSNGSESCPYCGMPLPSGAFSGICPTCNADLRS